MSRAIPTSTSSVTAGSWTSADAPWAAKRINSAVAKKENSTEPQNPPTELHKLSDHFLQLPLSVSRSTGCGQKNLPTRVESFVHDIAAHARPRRPRMGMNDEIGRLCHCKSHDFALAGVRRNLTCSKFRTGARPCPLCSSRT